MLVAPLVSVLVATIIVTAVPGAAAGIAGLSSEPVHVGQPFGFCHAGYSTAEWEYQLLDEIGATWTRVDFSWQGIEPTEGVFEFTYWDRYVDNATARGVKIIAILDYGVGWLPDAHPGPGHYVAPANIPYFLGYVNATVRRYKDRVAAFEIWNEPDSPGFWNGPREHFFQLFNETAALIHAIDPDVTIVGGSVTGNNLGYINAMFNAGIMNHVDVISFHPYSSNPNLIPVQIMEIQALARSRGFSGEFWITEVGNPTGGTYGHAVSGDELPSRVVKTLVHATALDIRCIIWYCLFDSPDAAKAADPLNSEHYFGLVYPNLTWKAGAHAHRAVAATIANSTHDPGGAVVRGLTARHAIAAFLYQRENGETTLVTWKDPASTHPWPLRVSLAITNASPVIEHHVDRDGSAVLDSPGSFEVTLQPRVLTFISAPGAGPVIIDGPESPVAWAFLAGAPLVGVLGGIATWRRARHRRGT